MPIIEPKGTGIHGLISHLSIRNTSTGRGSAFLKLVRPLILDQSKRGRHESTKRIDDFMGGLELKQIRKPRDDSIIESYRMGRLS